MIINSFTVKVWKVNSDTVINYKHGLMIKSNANTLADNYNYEANSNSKLTDAKVKRTN